MNAGSWLSRKRQTGNVVILRMNLLHRNIIYSLFTPTFPDAPVTMLLARARFNAMWFTEEKNIRGKNRK